MNNKLEILSLGVADIHNQTNFVVSVLWRLEYITSKTDETGQSIILCESGRTLLDYINPPESFIVFDNLTKETVVQWVINSTEYSIAEEKLNAAAFKYDAPSTMLKPLPWN